MGLKFIFVVVKWYNMVFIVVFFWIGKESLGFVNCGVNLFMLLIINIYVVLLDNWGFLWFFVIIISVKFG